jgi:hypothetical protein
MTTMKNIKIINGTYGYRAPGVRAVEPKRPGDPPFPLEDDKAERLVSLGVAAYADAEDGSDSPTRKKRRRTKDGGDGKPYGPDTKADELRALMKECGLTVKIGMTKADMIAALDEYFAEKESGDDVEEDDDGEEDEPPDLNPEDPVA